MGSLTVISLTDCVLYVTLMSDANRLDDTKEGLMNPQIQMIIAGFCIASWQILVNASGFPGPVANFWVLILSALFAVGTAVHLTTPVHLGSVGGLTTILFLSVVVAFRHVVPATATAYLLAGIAGGLSGVAVWQLNDVLSSVPKSQVGALLMLLVTTQLTTAATFHVGMQAYAGTFPLNTLAALVLAVGAGYLLYR